MHTDVAGTLPAPAVAAPDVQSAAKPSSLPSESDKAFQAKVDSFKSSDDIMGFVELLKSTKAPAKKAVEATPAETPAKQPAEPDPAAPDPTPVEEPAETPAEGDTPPSEPAEEPAPAEETVTPEADDDTEVDDGELTPLTAKNIKVKPREDDQVFRLQLRIMKRNRDLTGEEALARARKELGLDKPAEAKTQAPARKPDGLPDTPEEIQAKIIELKAKRKTASSNLELETYDQLTEQIEALAEKRTVVIEEAKEAQASAVRVYKSGFAASQAKAEDIYAFAADPESPGGKMMIEIDAALEANSDPLFNDPNKPLKLAQMAATRLNIPPKTKTPAATAKAAAPKAPVVPAPKKDVIPGGSSSTTPRTASVLKPLDQKIQDNARNSKVLDQTLRELGIEV